MTEESKESLRAEMENFVIAERGEKSALRAEFQALREELLSRSILKDGYEGGDAISTTANSNPFGSINSVISLGGDAISSTTNTCPIASPAHSEADSPESGLLDVLSKKVRDEVDGVFRLFNKDVKDLATALSKEEKATREKEVSLLQKSIDRLERIVIGPDVLVFTPQEGLL